jgi:hypothetical protein
MTPREKALSNVKDATTWVMSAVAAINEVTGYPGKRSEIEGLSQFKALKTHFHVSLGPPTGIVQNFLAFLPFIDEDPMLTTLKDIRFRYFDIASALSRSSIFVDSPAVGEGEDASAFVPRVRDGTLRITPLYLNLGALNQILVLIHEGAHFLGDPFQDYAYRSRKGAESSDPNKYLNLPLQYAMRNADSYAYFALQMGKNIDRILAPEE